MTQSEPQAVTLSFDAHTPRQSWVPDGHTPVQAAFAAMHSPAQALCPVGQAGRHCASVHDTLPPVGARHASLHEAPQESGDVSSKHASSQMWLPDGHAHVLLPTLQRRRRHDGRPGPLGFNNYKHQLGFSGGVVYHAQDYQHLSLDCFRAQMEGVLGGSKQVVNFVNLGRDMIGRDLSLRKFPLAATPRSTVRPESV